MGRGGVGERWLWAGGDKEGRLLGGETMEWGLWGGEPRGRGNDREVGDGEGNQGEEK